MMGIEELKARQLAIYREQRLLAVDSLPVIRKGMRLLQRREALKCGKLLEELERLLDASNLSWLVSEVLDELLLLIVDPD